MNNWTLADVPEIVSTIHVKMNNGSYARYQHHPENLNIIAYAQLVDEIGQDVYREDKFVVYSTNRIKVTSHIDEIDGDRSYFILIKNRDVYILKYIGILRRIENNDNDKLASKLPIEYGRPTELPLKNSGISFHEKKAISLSIYEIDSEIPKIEGDLAIAINVLKRRVLAKDMEPGFKHILLKAKTPQKNMDVLKFILSSSRRKHSQSAHNYMRVLHDLYRMVIRRQIHA